MIIHKLLLHHLSHRDDPAFYEMQATDAIHWLTRNGVTLSAQLRTLDLGCGHGILGRQLRQRGCDVWYADAQNSLLESLDQSRFLPVNIDKDELSRLGTYDLIICSNVYEHLARPWRFLDSIPGILNPRGYLYLSWTNWLSPWGGHEFSPFHFFGPRLGVRLYDRLIGRPRVHTPYVDLYPTYIGATLRHLRNHSQLRIRKVAPRYYPELGWIARIPLFREFLTWNCAMLLQRPAG
jgi:SAM-dependent methyltransferase